MLEHFSQFIGLLFDIIREVQQLKQGFHTSKKENISPPLMLIKNVIVRLNSEYLML